MHPYTQSLMSAVPVPDPRTRDRRRRIVLEGDIPNPAAPPPGCTFHTRCPLAEERCRRDVPILKETTPGHGVSCHLVS